MTAEEVFCELSDKYGDDFNWHMLPLSNHTFTAELKKEIGKNHFLYHKQIWQWPNVIQMMMSCIWLIMAEAQTYIIFSI